jgi:DNA-binding beta-propeller fold protein YncE
VARRLRLLAWPGPPAGALTLVAALGLGVSGCGEDATLAPLDRLLLPSGLAASPDGRWLFVTNGNWDRTRNGSALIALDLAAIAAGIADPLAADAALDAAHPCRRHPDDSRIECDPSLVLAPGLGVRMPSGAGNIIVDQPGGEQGPMRLLIPTRIEPSVVWVDVLAGADGLQFDCGQAEDRLCDSDHRIDGIRPDPSRLTLDQGGFRFAYLPHLLGRTMSLIELDGDRGPALADDDSEFFRIDERFDSDLGGGFAVVQRACEVETDNAPASSVDCTRPYLIASQRFWEGIRTFRVAPGLNVLLPGAELRVFGPNIEAAAPKPLMGGMVFEDPDRGERLLIVHTTPPALTRIDTSLDDNDDPRFTVLDSVSLCSNPNLVVVYRPGLAGQQGPDLALVSCYGSDQLAVVDLNVFVVVQTLDLGDGPNELLVDRARGWLLVANTAESSISIVDLDATRASYLTELATLGLGTRTR